jgi:hypothetical protein
MYLTINGWKMGYRYTGSDHTYKGAYFQFNEPIFAGAIGPIFCPCDINNIESIEYFYVETWPDPKFLALFKKPEASKE